MRAAAAAWDALAAELQSTATSYSSVVSSLTSGPWLGPSSLNMAAAVAPYVAWMSATAAQAAEAATQATAAASAYETAFAAHVPPVEIAANRSQLASLMATNIFGQNTAAIAATEAQYSEMWAQDALAMDTYAASSAAAAKVTPFTAAPQITNSAGVPSQAAAVAQAASTAPGSVQSLLTAAADPLTTANPVLQTLANLSTDYTSTINGVLNSLFGPSGASTITAMINGVKAPVSAFTSVFNPIGLLVNFPVSQFLKFAPSQALGDIPREGLGAGLGLGWPHWNRGTLFGSVSASMGNSGTLVGKLSVPPTWATATPAIRTVAAALSATAHDAVPAAALGAGSLLSSMSVAGMVGSALGAGAPTAVSRTGARGGLTPLKDLKDKHSPEQLQRLVAQISQKPESVQHHTVDEEGLDNLLEQLSKKPGIHAVHLSKGKGDKRKVLPSDAQFG